MNGENVRSWDTVCGDCAHLHGGRCVFTMASVQPYDSIAAVCHWFRPVDSPETAEKQIEISDMPQRKQQQQ